MSTPRTANDQPREMLAAAASAIPSPSLETMSLPPRPRKMEAAKTEAKAEVKKDEKKEVKKIEAKPVETKATTPKKAAIRKTSVKTAAEAQPLPGLFPANVEQEIRNLAYLLSERRGFAPGHEAEDWLTAEREVMDRYHQNA